MEYTVLPAPEKANSGWMAHRVKLWVTKDRHEEFFNFLNTYCGAKHEAWRIENRNKGNFWRWGDEPMRVRFKHKRHAALLKLQWEEDENPIQREMESLTAMFKKLSTTASITMASQRYAGKSLQAVGRGLRNVHVTTQAPPTNPNPLPWISQIDPLWNLYSSKALSRKSLGKITGFDYDSIFLDELKPKDPGPFWIQKNLEEEGHAVITTSVLKDRLNGTGLKPTTVCWDPQTLRLRDEVLPDAQPESGSGEGAGDIPDHQIQADGREKALRG